MGPWRWGPTGLVATCGCTDWGFVPRQAPNGLWAAARGKTGEGAQGVLILRRVELLNPTGGDNLAQEMPLLSGMASPSSASPVRLYDRGKNREGEVRIAPLVFANSSENGRLCVWGRAVLTSGKRLAFCSFLRLLGGRRAAWGPRRNSAEMPEVGRGAGPRRLEEAFHVAASLVCFFFKKKEATTKIPGD